MFMDFAKELSTEQGKRSVEEDLKKMEEFATAQQFVEGVKSKAATSQRPTAPKPKQELTAHQKKI